MSLKTVLACRNVSRDFEIAQEKVHVLKNIEFEAFAGQMISIVGSSGSGKTTLLNILAGLDDPSVGEVEMAGHTVAQLSDKHRASLRNQSMGFVFQFHHLLPEFSALDNVLMPCRINGKVSADQREYAVYLLTEVGLSNRINHRPAELSGGERQRVALARALINKPDFLLMDEPTGNLDEDTSESVQTLIQQLNKTTGATFITVTHNQDWANQHPVQYRLAKGSLTKI